MKKAYTLPERKRWKSLTNSPLVTFHIANKKLNIDPETRRAIRNIADENAAMDGCKFSERRAAFAINWQEKYCYLYEGDRAGKPIVLDDWQFEMNYQTFGWITYNAFHDKWVRRFREVSGWVPKKNTKSPSLAAMGLYMLCGEGEMGQKCFSVARDGIQAKIAHTHATFMVMQSPELNKKCKIDRTTGRITYLPTMSTYTIINDNPKSLEGLNGSLFVDETHVVGEQQMSRLKGATISRREPLHVELSTVGTDVNGYGYARWELGKKVRSGEVDNPSMYFFEFCAPQTITPEQIKVKTYLKLITQKKETDTPKPTIRQYRQPTDAKVVEIEDFDKYYDNFIKNVKITPNQEEYDLMDLILLTNPTIGRVLDPSEPIRTWNSCFTKKLQHEFLLYRLNIWQSQGVALFDFDAWKKCERPFKLKELAEYPCVLGLDLSRVKDLSAITIVFAVPDEFMGVRPP